MVNKLCPRCNFYKLEKNNIDNCLSRRNNKVYICNFCAYEEAIMDERNKILEEKLRENIIRLDSLWLKDLSNEEKQEKILNVKGWIDKKRNININKDGYLDKRILIYMIKDLSELLYNKKFSLVKK